MRRFNTLTVISVVLVSGFLAYYWLSTYQRDRRELVERIRIEMNEYLLSNFIIPHLPRINIDEAVVQLAEHDPDATSNPPRTESSEEFGELIGGNIKVKLPEGNWRNFEVPRDGVEPRFSIQNDESSPDDKPNRFMIGDRTAFRFSGEQLKLDRIPREALDSLSSKFSVLLLEIAAPDSTGRGSELAIRTKWIKDGHYTLKSHHQPFSSACFPKSASAYCYWALWEGLSTPATAIW